MTKPEKALQIKAEGANCAQSVFAAFAPELGVDKATSLKVTAGFGTGMRVGEVCGAASGAVMVLGLMYGSNEPAVKEPCNTHVAEFMGWFEEKFGSLTCRALLEEKGKSACEIFIREAAGYLEKKGR